MRNTWLGVLLVLFVFLIGFNFKNRHQVLKNQNINMKTKLKNTS